MQSNLFSSTDLDSLFPEYVHVSWESKISIRFQIVQQHVKKVALSFKNEAPNFALKYSSGESVIDMAKISNFPPCLLMKYVIQLLLPDIQRPDSLRNRDLKLKEAREIGDARLKAEIISCEEQDVDYSPAMDRIRQHSGYEYEFKLQRELLSRGIYFETENGLRRLGFHKTPDALLPIPVALEAEKGRISLIHWIDSKAMYGDSQTHLIDNKKQFQGYVNRFGQGLVIYWFGYDESISLLLPDVMVASSFPFL